MASGHVVLALSAVTVVYVSHMSTISTAPKHCFGWGILGPGRIAEKFCADLALVPDSRVAAVGSRSLARAEAFSARHGGRAHASYAAMIEDPQVDVVYVASPHSLHFDHTAMALKAGKAVLCEKPLTLDAESARALFAIADAHSAFLMEAMWMTCNPLIQKVRRLLGQPDYGSPRQVHADMGFVAKRDLDDRLWDPQLGAGVLLDMGIYPLTFAHLLLGSPLSLAASAHLIDGVDANLSISGSYPNGAVAALTASMTCQSPRTASVSTEIGRFDFATNFHRPTSVQWTAYWEPQGQATMIVPDEPVIGLGYGNEIAEVQRCLREGLPESPLVPRAQTIGVLEQMDLIRSQLGVSYLTG